MSKLDFVPLRVLALLASWAVLILLLLVYWITQATGSKGRLIFPGLIAAGAGLDWWLRLLSGRLRLGGWAALLLVLLGVSVYSLAWLLPQAHSAPAPVAIEVGAGRYHPGERVPATLYWRAD